MGNLRNIVVFTGAGISAESGLKTFRDAGGLWENHAITDVATPEAWARDPGLVNTFYNQRRRQLQEVHPNPAHEALARLEAGYEVQIITQNVDDLHERAGSRQVLHLHGELRKVRSTGPSGRIWPWDRDLSLEDRCPDGWVLRPHIVWFGEEVPAIQTAIPLVGKADMLLVVGTSLLVYPAAGLLQFAASGTPIIYIDPHPGEVHGLSPHRVDIRAQPASIGVPALVEELLGSFPTL